MIDQCKDTDPIIIIEETRIKPHELVETDQVIATNVTGIRTFISIEAKSFDNEPLPGWMQL